MSFLQSSILLAALLFAGAGVSAQTPPKEQAAGPAQPAPARFQVVRSLSGSKGHQEGSQYIIEDPRTVFSVTEDRKVIVYFEWEGPLGFHRFQGLWKNPEARVVMVSDFQYEATAKRFAGYWSMLLDEAMPTGFWTLEARIDGESAGTLTFQILSAAKPPEPPPARKVLSPAELYDRAKSATAFIDKLAPDGSRADRRSGFFLGENLLYTVFQSIDGAAKLRIVLDDGRQFETDTVVAWNRWQDWAVIKLDVGKALSLVRSASGTAAVGDRCFVLDVASEGSRVINEVGVTGRNSVPRSGERLNLSAGLNQAGTGSPVLNEFGDVVAIAGTTLLPGTQPMEALRVQGPSGGTLMYLGGSATPISAVPSPAADNPLSTLADLAAQGQMVPLVTAQKNVDYGMLASDVNRNENPPWPTGEKDQFSIHENRMVVFILWQPKEKRKAIAKLQFYNLENTFIGQTTPSKVDLKPGNKFATTFDVQVKNLPVGIYRVDLMLDDQPAWRRFFRVTE